MLFPNIPHTSNFSSPLIWQVRTGAEHKTCFGITPCISAHSAAPRPWAVPGLSGAAYLRRTPPRREALRHSGGESLLCTSPTVTLYLEVELRRERRPGTEQKTSLGFVTPPIRPSLFIDRVEMVVPLAFEGMGTGRQGRERGDHGWETPEPGKPLGDSPGSFLAPSTRALPSADIGVPGWDISVRFVFSLIKEERWGDETKLNEEKKCERSLDSALACFPTPPSSTVIKPKVLGWSPGRLRTVRSIAVWTCDQLPLPASSGHSVEVGWQGEALGPHPGLGAIPLPALGRDRSCSPALHRHTAASHRTGWTGLSSDLRAPHKTRAMLGWPRAVFASMRPQEPVERLSFTSALGLAPQQAAALNFHHPWLKGSLRRSNPINPAQTSFYLMGKSQLRQEVRQAMVTAASHRAHGIITPWVKRAWFSHTSFQ